MGTRIAINGFGRIGRCITRILFDSGRDDLELVAVNDLTDNDTLAHLLRYDSIHRTFGHDVKVDGEHMIVGGHRFRAMAERDPAKLPWKDIGVDVVMECTGRFRDRDSAGKHIAAGAKRVIISAPGGGDIDATFCVGINSDGYDAADHKIVSNASCTTNCLSPVAKVLNDTFGIVKGSMVTIHSYTNDQHTLDAPHKDLRRARAAAMSMIPTSTGAAKAIGLVLPALAGKLDGSAIRVPTPNVSLVSLVATVSKATSVDAVNDALRKAAEGPLDGILGFEEAPLVSSDFIGDTRSSVVDARQTQVVGGDLVQVQAWYDNEWGFSARMLDLARILAGG
jgi:glyceraldehyde 3-phosphate dehydrogenase